MLIYTLKLEKNKWYVGKTTNPLSRLDDHFKHGGSSWTRKYKPLSIDKMFEGDSFDEDKWVLIYMDKYGIENVRGGSYSTIELDTIQLEMLKRQLMSTNDKCFRCWKKRSFYF